MSEPISRRMVLRGGVVSLVVGMCPRLDALAKDFVPTRVKLQHVDVNNLQQQWADAHEWSMVHGCE